MLQAKRAGSYVGLRTQLAEMKARQRSSIQQIAEVLAAAGFHALDDRARVLDLPRSTVWTVLNPGHKASGLTAKVVAKILASPHLHPEVRAHVCRYVQEKSGGLYGHTFKQRQRFAIRLLSLQPEASHLFSAQNLCGSDNQASDAA
jgi:hypothetical protein